MSSNNNSLKQSSFNLPNREEAFSNNFSQNKSNDISQQSRATHNSLYNLSGLSDGDNSNIINSINSIQTQEYQSNFNKFNLKKFTINYQKKLGEGGYGNVYKAYHQQTKQQAAVKVINYEHIDNIQYLQRQIKILKNLQHQNIVECYGFLLDEKKHNLYIFMECCDGDFEDLIQDRYKKDQEFSQIQCIVFSMQIIKAFQYLQKLRPKVYHRDLKPKNILIKNGILKLADFGLSRIDQDQTKSITVAQIGTVYYMAPKMIKEQQYDPVKCDVWSFGCVLYKLLHGKLQWQNIKTNTGGKLLNHFKKNQIKINRKQITEELKQFCLNCLEINEQKRSSWQQLEKNPLYLRYKKDIQMKPIEKKIIQQVKQIKFLKNFYLKPQLKQYYYDSQYVNKLIKKKQFEEAFLLAREAAQKKFSAAYGDLATIFVDNNKKNIFKRNYEKAYQFALKGAKYDNVNAQNNLGICFKNGYGVQRNIDEAFKWFTKAAQKEYEVAQNNIGICYQNGEGVQKSEKTAAQWFMKAANKGYAVAQTNLGECYQQGIGVQKDEKKALELYMKAINQDYAKAKNILGICYQQGVCVEKNYQNAVKWYTEAALQGYANAQYNLSLCYKNGIEVQQNQSKAKEWEKIFQDTQAAERGYRKITLI